MFVMILEVLCVAVGLGILVGAHQYFRGMRFKEVSWRWTAINLIFTWHGGRNPVSGHRFLYIGVGPFLGFDFYWPEERKQREPVIWDDIGNPDKGMV